ncbi:hypothetical protein BGW36DRAFT_422319 [Talaromyces proteolyticus]|uniref:Transcription factor domain-containing protein n=1 Tax=Talaromyces proteolyticus TaxID=1131652 RepID=A0AAD4L1E4_9EURO|nr:uncharacterized protein BGW36DRAFT_422319 [Talaromyces proteolyticus]KAH8705783.1 hypothetical protein BGW36DRAFT_422319 [Talaromyces proteolyticus]
MTGAICSRFAASGSGDLTSLCIDRFFESIRAECSPLLSVLSWDSIGAIVQASTPVTRIISALGSLFARKDDKLSLRTKRQFTESAQQSRLHVTYQLHCSSQGKAVKCDDTSFLGALLLGFLELATDASGLGWYSLFKGALRNQVWQRGPRGFSGTLEESLLSLYWICEGMRALSFDEDSRIMEWQNLDTQTSDHIHTGFTMSRQFRGQKEGRLAHCMALLGSLNKRCLTWVYNSRRIKTHFAHSIDKSIFTENYSNKWVLHLLAGKEIVMEGFRVRDEILHLAPSLSLECDIGQDYPLDFIMPFYYCGLVSVSRRFIDPLWQLVNEELPLLPEEMIRSHSLVALSFIEQRLMKVNLESVFYLPLLLGISLEVRSACHRQRILRLFQRIENKGFVVARTFTADIQLAWSLAPT